MMTPNYSSQFSTSMFWSSLAKYMKRLGRKSLLLALKLYYAAQDPATPVWAKGIIFSALGYLISPIDSIPDMLPVIGLTDDLAVLTAALATVAAHVTESHRLKAEARLQAMFG
ncbi:DUF1232 domain-containing protein [Shewanella decolorationis]|uniref:DUF1232 domain-containing protein n=1 Tax=Shewanella decolorationis TaxID=256839 RepID=A0A5B8QW33_9GAMM|nr:YkvA family protein [Shewanella decolorationis]QDZ90833.1 DUF1232 domain-containing protein [Shewanella decolorationis]